MKKLSLILAMILTMSTFASCGLKKESDSEGDSTSASREKDDKDERKSKDDSSKKDDKDKSNSKKLSRGTVENNIYSNDFFDLKFEVPDEWSVYTDDEIRATMNIGLQAGGSKADVDDVFEASGCDFLAGDKSSGESIMITYEDLSKYPDNFSIDDYISASKLSTQISMPNMDIKWNENGEKDVLCGIEFDVIGMEVSVEEYGVSITQDYYLRMMDGYLIAIIYSSGITSNSISDYTDYFID